MPPQPPGQQSLRVLDTLLGHVVRLRSGGDRQRYDADDMYRWAIHRLWIAVGGEARTYVSAAGLDPSRAQPWAGLRLQRNLLAHQRLDRINDDRIWRVTVMRTDQYRRAVRALLK